MGQSKGLGCCGLFFGGMFGGALLVIICIAMIVNTGRQVVKDQKAAKERELQAEEATHKTIPGLSAVDVYGVLEPKGFQLEHLPKIESGEAWNCVSEYEGCELRGDTFGDGTDRIRSVRATVRHKNAGDPVPTAKEFLGFIATLKYDGAQPAQARKWVEEHVAEKASTVIGGVKFETYGTQWVRMLLMEPVRDAEQQK